jgi:hypothetical protein
MAPKRLFFAVCVTAATALATMALAQPRGKPAPKPARPPTVVRADAQAPEDTSASSADAGKTPPAVATAGTSEAPPAPPPEPGDGGRMSPLNPQPQELPSNAVDAGAPVDYDRLLADIAALRARVAALGDNLYQSRVSVALQTDGDHARIARLTVSLDDGVVYTAPATFAASDMTQVYDHAVAPGRHAVTVDVERRDGRDEAFRTSQRSRFTIDVPRDNRVEVQVKILDDSSMGADFPSDKSGKYDLRLRVKAVAMPVGK